MSIKKTLNVTNMIGYRLKQTQHILRLHMDDALRNLELTTPQYSVLSQLELEPGVSNAELARRSFITPQTMHGIVSNLEKRNLITRANNPDHGRILSTKLTEKGCKILQKAHLLIHTIERKMTADLTSRDIIYLDEILGNCIENLNEKKA